MHKYAPSFFWVSITIVLLYNLIVNLFLKGM